VKGEGLAAAFSRDVTAGLARRPKEIPPKYFYDEVGSLLFEVICRLPWYPITRAERALLSGAADDIVSPLGYPLTLLELGPGSGQKLSIVAEAAARRGGKVAVHLVDLSEAALATSARTLSGLGIPVTGHRAPFEDGLREAARERGEGVLLVLFLGSNIGNLDFPAAEAFLCEIRGVLSPGDGLLLGVDLVKPERDLILAYDDPIGVTAAFNKNLLARMNRELGADFDLSAFAHRAVWNPFESRVEMHLVARRPVCVSVPAAGCVARFEEGEILFTESSYKYEVPQLREMGEGAGFRQAGLWLDETARFALALFSAV
jgi:dimethylhistidine N-methyltransferase